VAMLGTELTFKERFLSFQKSKLVVICRISWLIQFMEGLTDRQEAFAVRDRLAWKYALSLDLCDPGFDHSVLSEFRSRLVESHAEQRLLDLLLERCREGG
jgi:transposase